MYYLSHLTQFLKNFILSSHFDILLMFIVILLFQYLYIEEMIALSLFSPIFDVLMSFIKLHIVPRNAHKNSPALDSKITVTTLNFHRFSQIFPLNRTEFETVHSPIISLLSRVVVTYST